MKPFRVFIINYNERVREIHNLEKYLPPPLMKGQDYNEADWEVRDKGLSENNICVAARDGLPISMRDELDEKDKYYQYVPHIYWCDLL